MYTIIGEQGKEKYFLNFRNNEIIANKPMLYNNKNMATIILYKIMVKQNETLKYIYHKHFKNEVSWKRFKKSYYNTTKLYILKIQIFD